ncbi:hypothetical protein AVM11_00355 [Sphingomonas melonis TY]|jgi:hypothetical protein|uniref:Lipoprotein n=1 Tax=Sphingomonas melonis TY TaxID=621456 RepID=A0A154NA97_9SPHN|nr:MULTISPECIES: hypothetical protein [Sphingomonas]AOW23952.1 hypothetical protein BJP26_10510 [Sphingomonas melonis TY]ATI54984.1 hypothetical protein CP552_04500 [Sphingomonas melonis]KZB96644.1 hypothetical protein AVM11_00355 [Sphingomonas melonis TY]MBI0532701.1 hypothetical protein [Sphingomonas sp. TX0522]MBX8843450.1 hypothetical protein [Sphingomonas melonis]
MATTTRYGKFLMTSAACLALAGCGGADNVASPGAGSVTIVQPAPTPTPTAPTPTPSAITAAQFAAVTTVNGISITADEQLAIVNAGSNNNTNGTGAQMNGVYPVSSTSLTTATDPSSINSFFTSTNYVGALNGPSDTSFQGWTCNSTAAEFGGSGARCTAVPAIGTLASGTACPTGTVTATGGSGTATAATVGGFKVCDIPQAITTSLTLPRIPGIAYRLTGQTEVGTDLGSTGGTGATLTIEAGVTVFSNANEATNDLLLVNRGSKLVAIGTRDAPIIFTSQQNVTSATGESETSQGHWGGIILLGRAPTGVCASGTGPNNAAGSSTTCQQAIEGVTGRFYGGPTVADSSGQMSYVQIRYSGIAISDGNELQGLTLGGTGSGTIIDHLQSHNSADDGIEIFGGNTNIKYIAVTGADDDGFDIDNGYRGFMQFMIAAQRVGGATVDSFSTEIDSNNAEDLLPRTFSTYANFTFIQTALAPAAIRQRGGSDMRYVNGIVKTVSNVACINLVAGEQTSGGRTTIRPKDDTLQDFGPPTFNSIYFACQGR